MLSLTKSRVLGGLLTIALAGLAALAFAQDKDAVIKNRADTMRQQLKDVLSVKAYLDDKGDLAAAQAGATNLVSAIKKIPDLFPPGTSGPDPTGKWAAKPEIWSDWNKFLAGQKTVTDKVDALVVAVKGGSKDAIKVAYEDLGVCKDCHTPFRERLKD